MTDIDALLARIFDGMDTCLCSHPRSEHEAGAGCCLPGFHPACGCGEYRPDAIKSSARETA